MSFSEGCRPIYFDEHCVLLLCIIECDDIFNIYEILVFIWVRLVTFISYFQFSSSASHESWNLVSIAALKQRVFTSGFKHQTQNI